MVEKKLENIQDCEIIHGKSCNKLLDAGWTISISRGLYEYIKFKGL